MVEFILEQDGTTYHGVYLVDDELAVTVKIAGKQCRTPLVDMRPAAEAIVIARQMIGGESALNSACSNRGDADINGNRDTAGAFASWGGAREPRRNAEGGRAGRM
jgi:hypothetical protein